MRFAEFEEAARAVWETIPARYRDGIDGLIVTHDARPHEDDPDVFTLGECLTEEYPSSYGGPDTIRSAVALYYGSFEEVARDNESFDWNEEIRDTIMHELQHHLESLATEDSLEDFDYAVDQNYRRVRGEAFDPLFYRVGERIGAVNAANAINAADAFKVEGDVFVEIRTRSGASEMEQFVWLGVEYQSVLPETTADITYHYVDGGPDIGEHDFCIVRVLERGVIATLRSALGRGYTVEEVAVAAEIVA